VDERDDCSARTLKKAEREAIGGDADRERQNVDEALREFASRIETGMIGVNIGVAAPMALSSD